MQAWVIDSKMLQSVELRQHFRCSPIYKQESLDGVRHGLSVVGGHPDQTIRLQSGDYVARLYPEVAEDFGRLTWAGPSGDIRHSEVSPFAMILDIVMHAHCIGLVEEICHGCKCTGPDAD